MKTTDSIEPQASAGGNAKARRSPWESPRILYREPLETVAALCAPAPPAKGNPGACPTGPISS